MDAAIPDDVRRMLAASIASIRQLDALLLMREAGGSRRWTVSALNAKLRSSETALEGDLAGLLDAKLVEVLPGPPTEWTYAPGDQARTVDKLASCYRTHRTTVIRLVTSGDGGDPGRGHARSQIDDFADAFRIRRKDTPDG